jgi:hypothetical protein
MNTNGNKWWRTLIVGTLVVILPCAVYARDRGVNQPGAARNRRRP